MMLLLLFISRGLDNMQCLKCNHIRGFFSKKVKLNNIRLFASTSVRQFRRTTSCGAEFLRVAPNSSVCRRIPPNSSEVTGDNSPAAATNDQYGSEDRDPVGDFHRVRFFLTMLWQHSQYDSRLGFSFRVFVRVRVRVKLGLG